MILIFILLTLWLSSPLKLLTFPHKFKTLSNKIRDENTDTHLTLI